MWIRTGIAGVAKLALLWLVTLSASLVRIETVRGEALAKTLNRPPNILLITADNLGYGDLRSYNPKSMIKTPHLDQLAREGARLTSFYTASSTCTVSRACLLTGRVAQRHGLLNQLGGVKGNYGVGLRHSEVLIPQWLKRAKIPYATGCFGKWNIGFAEGSRPTERGFDEFIGHASGNLDYYHHNYRERHDLFRGVSELHRDGEYSTDIFADAAVEFVKRKGQTNDQPWFCYLPFNAPHFPTVGNKRPGQPNIWQAPDWAFKQYDWPVNEKDPQRRYAAVVTALDQGIGRVLNALHESGQTENTFVFFMSDNGGFRLGRKGLDIGSNAPLRHGGVTCWEGGIRVAAMARWPQHIKAGSTIDEPFWSPDILQACLKLAGVPRPVGVRFDGRDPLPLLTRAAKSPHESLYFAFRNHAALRKGDWKIVRERPQQAWRLYNLTNDLGEQNNLAQKEAERVADLARTFRDWEKSFESPQ